MPHITLNGTAGNDRLIGGRDLIRYTVHLNGLAGHDLLSTGRLTSAVIHGGMGNDTIIGDNLFDHILYGDAGNDFIELVHGESESIRHEAYGGSGNDTIASIIGLGSTLIDGGAGADSMTGGECRDIFIVDDVGDVVVDEFVPQWDNVPNPIDEVRSSVSFTLGRNVEDLSLTGAGSINGTGNGLANLIGGNAGNNLLSGEGGADTLDGGHGHDTLDGGAGFDTLRFSGALAVRVNLALTGPQATGFGRDTVRNIENVLTGAGNDTILGNAVANILTAGAGNDVLAGMGNSDRLFGQGGNDRLRGGVGNDTLHGGAGSDSFIFANLDGTDRILDFADGQDRIIIESGAEQFADLRITDLGADAQVRFGNVTITLANVDHALLTAEDFLFT